jgi:hypothetical protein
MQWLYTGNSTTLEDLQAQVGKGWHAIIAKLVDDLLALGWDGTVAQVKEKFGGLRFYVGRGSNAIFDRINQAEAESFQVCETCGAPGILRSTGWYKTRCDECQAAFELERSARYA